MLKVSIFTASSIFEITNMMNFFSFEDIEAKCESHEINSTDKKFEKINNTQVLTEYRHSL